MPVTGTCLGTATASAYVQETVGRAPRAVRGRPCPCLLGALGVAVPFLSAESVLGGTQPQSRVCVGLQGGLPRTGGSPRPAPCGRRGLCESSFWRTPVPLRVTVSVKTTRKTLQGTCLPSTGSEATDKTRVGPAPPWVCSGSPTVTSPADIGALEKSGGSGTFRDDRAPPPRAPRNPPSPPSCPAPGPERGRSGGFARYLSGYHGTDALCLEREEPVSCLPSSKNS